MLKLALSAVKRVARGLWNAIAGLEGNHGTSRRYQKIGVSKISKEDMDRIEKKFGPVGLNITLDIFNTCVAQCPNCKVSGSIMVASDDKRNSAWFLCNHCGGEWKKTWSM